MSDLKTHREKKNDGETVARVIQPADSATPDLVSRADACYALGDWQGFMDTFQTIFPQRGLHGFTPLTRLDVAINRRSLSSDETEAFWQGCADDSMRRGGKIVARLKANDLAGVRDDFADLVRVMFADGQLRRTWEGNFDLLLRALGGEAMPPPSTLPRRKIFVSGTGWSGSGAIYDYLREFPEVFPIPGERRTLISDDGFSGFVRTAADPEACAGQSIDFFFRHMLGADVAKRGIHLRSMRFVRRAYQDPDYAQRHAGNCGAVVQAMAQLLRSSREGGANRMAALKALCGAIVDQLMICEAPADRIAMLDNCIFVRRIPLARYLENSDILCSVRDPRSNYVACVREDIRFDKSVPAYIRKQADERSRNAEKLRATSRQIDPAAKVHIRLIRFEEFVTSPCLRDELMRSIGLDPAWQRKYTRFKPWESFRNTQIHHEYEDQAAIAEIARELPEYCVDFAVVPMRRAGCSDREPDNAGKNEPS